MFGWFSINWWRYWSHNRKIKEWYLTNEIDVLEDSPVVLRILKKSRFRRYKEEIIELVLLVYKYNKWIEWFYWNIEYQK
jgi:hypothetical protein